MFLFARRIIGTIVTEKEKGTFEFLIINGMSETSYNLSIILHEFFVNGVMICGCLDFLLWYRLFHLEEREFTEFI